MRPPLRILAVTFALAALGALAPAAAPPTELRIHAGKHDRRQTLVGVSVAGLPPGHYELRPSAAGASGASGAASIPIQIDPAHRAWFVLPSLDAGQERTYTIYARAQASGAVAAAAQDNADLRASINSRAVLTYIGGTGRLPSPDIKPVYRRGGYIHPVRTPSGRIVTDDYPSDHYHQHGVMMAWTSVVFEGRKTDFWNMGNSLARVEAIGVANRQSGPVFAGWIADHHYVDLTSGAPKIALRELWQIRVYALDAANVFDIDVRQEAPLNQPVSLPEYHYGGMAVRGAASFRGDPKNAVVLTSEGKDRVGADNSRARWAHIGGQVDGAMVGIAILGHPDNFRAPQPLRVHPTDPYICFAPSRLGPWSITTETPHVVKYRFVAADGPANAALLERIWRDYADPPTVTLK